MRRSPLRAMAGWLAAFSLILHLTAVAACAASPVPGLAAGPFPICHAAGVGEQTAGRTMPDHDGGGPHEPCPLCSICCHVSMALPSTFGAPAPVRAVVSVETPRVAQVGAGPTVRCIAASPRGPPGLG